MKPVVHTVMVLAAIALFCAVTLCTSGCGGTQELARYAEAGRDLAAVAKPCLVAVKDQKIEACEGDERCEAQVYDAFAPVADALDLMHKTWCTVSPESEGC